jgi:hypothetical protein
MYTNTGIPFMELTRLTGEKVFISLLTINWISKTSEGVTVIRTNVGYAFEVKESYSEIKHAIERESEPFGK